MENRYAGIGKAGCGRVVPGTKEAAIARIDGVADRRSVCFAGSRVSARPKLVNRMPHMTDFALPVPSSSTRYG